MGEGGFFVFGKTLSLRQWFLKSIMQNQEIEKIKEISIRGRFAYGLFSLEQVTELMNLKNPELQVLFDEMWKVTDSVKIGWWQELLIENNPFLVLKDYDLFKNGKVSLQEIGFLTIKNKQDFEDKVNFLKQLEWPISAILNKLSEIANQNLYAGCGKYSESTWHATVELINILESIPNFTLPKIELVEFSKFNENNGWGNKFKREQIIENSKLHF